MRIGLIGVALASIVGSASPALADDRLEASAFFGGQTFASDVGLGRSMFAEQRPQTSPLTGARLTILALPSVAGDAHTHLDIGLEAEVAMAAAFTGYGFGTGRDSYFSPVFGWRGDLMLRLSAGDIRPHLVIGGGGATIVSSSPYMTKETVGEFLWGAGVTFQVKGNWQIRLDGRQGLLPTMSGGTASSFEGSFAVGTSFGFPQEKAPPPHVEPPVDRPKMAPDVDSDGDGIPDSVDKCPHEPETVNGLADDDGCPEPDPDGDGIVGDKDLCPNAPEDFDHFQDEDGCPDPDNDGDGIPDIKDACPNEPETVNGFQDDDGCPDSPPADLQKSLGAVGAVKFDAGKARVTDPAKKALEPVVALLRDHPTIRVTLSVHPDQGAADAMADLAKKRGNAIKGYLQDQGVGMDQVTVVVLPDPPKPKGGTLELALAPAKK